MFFNKFTEEELYSSLESELQKQYSFDNNLSNNKIALIESYLKTAVAALSSAGLFKEAEEVESVIMVIEDPATEGLSGDNIEEMAMKMENNLKEKGWVFNTDDEETEETEECSKDEPQLSQKELKELRDLLK